MKAKDRIVALVIEAKCMKTSQTIKHSSGSPITGMCLPKLPAKLYELNCCTLQPILVAIAKDLKIEWSGETPHYWPSEIPFVNPESVPTEHKGK